MNMEELAEFAGQKRFFRIAEKHARENKSRGKDYERPGKQKACAAMKPGEKAVGIEAAQPKIEDGPAEATRSDFSQALRGGFTVFQEAQSFEQFRYGARGFVRDRVAEPRFDLALYRFQRRVAIELLRNRRFHFSETKKSPTP